MPQPASQLPTLFRVRQTGHQTYWGLTVLQVLQGVLLSALSSLIYAVLNVLYDYTVESTPNPPAHTDMMGHMAKASACDQVWMLAVCPWFTREWA